MSARAFQQEPEISPGGRVVAQRGPDPNPDVVGAKPRHRRRLGWGFWVATGWVIGIGALALFAHVLPIPNPNNIGSGQPGLGPSVHHLMGTDDLGRDLLSRIIYGARVSLTVGFVSIGLALLIGGSIGLLAGYYRGTADTLIMAFTTVLLAFPALILALAVVTFVGRGLWDVMLAVALLSIAPLTLVVRSSTIRFAERDSVFAAHMLGAKDVRIIAREILPNVIPTIVAFGLVAIATAIVAEGALAFLGLSVAPPTPTWGGMIAEGKAVLQQQPMVAIWPSLVLFVTVLALNLAGDRLRRCFDLKEASL